MNILLLLSALLSVLTGVGAGATRAPVAAQQVAALVRTAGKVAVVPKASAGPLQLFDVVAARRSVVPLRMLSLSVLAPYVSRRRE